LACGGAERCVTLLARGLLQRGHDISVVTIHGEEQDFFQLPQGTNRLALGIDGDSATVVHGLANNLRRLKVLRNSIKSTQPDIVISHIHRTNIITILAVGQALPVIAVEHNDPGMNPLGKIWDTLRRRTYPRAQRIVSVSRGVDEYFSWLAKEQRAIIHNPIENNHERGSFTVPDPERNWIGSMGRLTPQKGFDLLLTAFAGIARFYPDWGLLIIGDGELREGLEELARTLGVSSQVTFAGRLADPHAALRACKLFVMGSRFEGFPYAALEALANGLPVVYTNCPSGPREIIRPEVDGLLVPPGNITALSAAMDRLMSNKEERERFAAQAPAVFDRFGLDRIIAQWEALVASIISANRSID